MSKNLSEEKELRVYGLPGPCHGEKCIRVFNFPWPSWYHHNLRKLDLNSLKDILEIVLPQWFFCTHFLNKYLLQVHILIFYKSSHDSKIHCDKLSHDGPPRMNNILLCHEFTIMIKLLWQRSKMKKNRVPEPLQGIVPTHISSTVNCFAFSNSFVLAFPAGKLLLKVRKITLEQGPGTLL